VTGTWSGGSLIGDPEGYVEECLLMGVFLQEALLGKLERNPFTGDFKRWMR
jgi:hypothetical protein